MPIINGQKMACEPCIRGHRSTKCNHADERLMVPVRKPGRPLSVCPHPPNKACSCSGGVTAAIPRAQKCKCGGNTPQPAPSPARSEAASGTGPGSPSKKSHYIRKASTKQANRIDPTAFERTDSSQISFHDAPLRGNVLLPALTNHNSSFTTAFTDGSTQVAYPSAVPLPTEAAVAWTDGFSHFGSDADFGGAYGMHGQGSTAIGLATGGMELGLAQQADYEGKRLNGAVSGVLVMPNGRSMATCCAPASSASKHTPSSSTDSLSSSALTSTTSSCCSRKSEGNGGGLPQYLNGAGFQPRPNAKRETHLNGQGMAGNGTTHTERPVVYTYPPSFGTASSPLQLDQWRQTMAAVAAVGHAGRADAGRADAGAFSQTAASPLGIDVSGSIPGTSHTCSCGDACDCLGCTAHPFNEASMNYVQSAMLYMASPTRPEAYSGSTNEDACNGRVGSGVASAAEPSSPQAAQTPSDGSGAGDEQQLPENDFFYVNYPLTSCRGETASCPCGDDCKCFGCFVHNLSFDQT